MIARADQMPGDGDLARAENEAIYWRGMARQANERAQEHASRYLLMLGVALCEAGIIVVLAMIGWRAGM